LNHDGPYNAVLDHLPIGIWVGRVPDGRVAYTNRAFVEITGIGAVADSQIGDAPRIYGACDRAGRPYPVEALPFSRVVATDRGVMVDDIVLHHPYGRKVNLRAFGEPLRDSDGKTTHVIVAFLDITREVAAETDRATMEARLRLAVDHAPIAIFTINREGIITLSEGAGLKPLGVRSGELVGQSVFDLYRDHPTIPGYIRRGLAGDSFWYTVEVGPAVYDTWLTPLRDTEGHVVGAVGVSNDVGEMRRLQANVVQNARVLAMGTLAASVAHEINNPLAYVVPHLHELSRELGEHASRVAKLRGIPGHDDLMKAIERMEESLSPVRVGVDRIAGITRDLRTFSRPEDQILEPTDVGQVLDSILKLTRKDLETRANLVISIGNTAPVMGNGARLVQVLSNLMMNAAQALVDVPGTNNRISVTTRQEGDRVWIEVADTGPGVPIVDRERVFEPFMTTKSVGAGTGLGLFVCRNITRDLGGDILIEDAPGGGALFRVWLPALPRTEVAAARGQAEDRNGPSLAGVRVLIVDDDPMVAGALALGLRSAGAGVQVATSGATAFDLLKGSDGVDMFDLVYCDLMMPGLTGMAFMEAVRAHSPQFLRRIVFMTGGAFTPQAEAFVNEHAAICVHKPFDVTLETERRLSALR
jgi:PAS domain S-box-containing protein